MAGLGGVLKPLWFLHAVAQGSDNRQDCNVLVEPNAVCVEKINRLFELTHSFNAACVEMANKIFMSCS